MNYFDLTLTTDFAHMLVRFLICVLVNWIIIDRLYYAKSKRRDFFFTFMLISIAIFFLVYFMIFVLEDMKGKTSMGIGIGLFGIFSIMRYRTDTMPVREMTYLFVTICLSVVNALAVSMSFGELIATNIIVILAVWLCEKKLKVQATKIIQYDRIELVKPERREELIADLESRTGLKILEVEIGGLDMLRDTALIKVSYETDLSQKNTVDGFIKPPKGGLLLMFAMLLAMPAVAQDKDTDTGLWTSIEARKKINKQWSITGEAEYRLQDDFSTSDRWTVGLSTQYKPIKGIKFDAGYKFMQNYSPEETKYKANGITVNKIISSYWGTRHRIYASVTGSMDFGPFTASLRERWQYTYRPEKTVDRWDNDEEEWETKTVGGKARHVLRSRLQLSYGKKGCPWEPYLSAEMYNAKGGIDKMRYTIGTDYKISKQHSVGAFYRYINDREDDINRHIIGIGYQYKF